MNLHQQVAHFTSWQDLKKQKTKKPRHFKSILAIIFFSSKEIG